MASAQRGYYRFPSISGDKVVFACEDDLWFVKASGGRAERLTAGVAEASKPRLSPDGKSIAFVGKAEGPTEVFVMPAEGGRARRVTFQGANILFLGFSQDGKEVLYSTNAARPFMRDYWLNAVALEGGLPRELPLGPASLIAFGGQGGVVLSRQPSRDAFTWKRYRGGTAGRLWIDPEGSGKFHPLLDELAGNLANPCWVGQRIFFLSDHEGHSNVYSCAVHAREPRHGGDLRRHSDHRGFYARNLASDGARLVYHAGAELWLLDPASSKPERIDVRSNSARTQQSRKFVPAERFVESISVRRDGTSLALGCRGQAFSFHPWDGAVTQHGVEEAVRYRLTTWLPDGKRLVAAASGDDEVERIVLLTADGSAPPERLTGDVGRVVSIEVAPTRALAAITNHRNELWLLDVDKPEPVFTKIDRSRFERIAGTSFSPDSRFLAYSFAETLQTLAIKIHVIEDDRQYTVTRPVLRDELPVFDPEGRYLYFIGKRDLDPVYDSLHFDLGFPKGSRPYVVTLKKDTPSPFLPRPRPVLSEPAEELKIEQKELSQQVPRPPAPVEIDFDGIERRVLAFPVPEGRYVRVQAARGAALFSVFPIEGAKGKPVIEEEPPANGALEVYRFETQKHERLIDGISDFVVGADGHTLLYRAGNRFRVLAAGKKPAADAGDKPGRESGWLDLSRVKVSIEPTREWRQMFHEGWRLQREQFWVENISGVDWHDVRHRYRPLLELVASRSEFSDLMWEVHGELGTSHAYEMGGDYRPGPNYRQGFLGADLAYDSVRREYRIARLIEGDPWQPSQTSPLYEPGLDVAPGDVIVSVNGMPVGAAASPGERLTGQADNRVQLGLRRGDGPVRSVSILASADERPARYRDWVEHNRRWVHGATSGKVGYIHIPDMQAYGYAEFHRGYLVEYDRDALLVDVRFNAGGHVSGLLLEKLRRRRIGYDVSRWDDVRPYPNESPLGPMLALTNELAGSDGDIFSHSFKLFGLGPLVGKRTWGGVIGIWPRHSLADGTLTTQPEFSFWFEDVGWRVENYGTDPDVDVDNAPHDYAAGNDHQLERSVSIMLDLLGQRPVQRPALGDRPVLTAPGLPERG
jgi:tricorn protease